MATKEAKTRYSAVADMETHLKLPVESRRNQPQQPHPDAAHTHTHAHAPWAIHLTTIAPKKTAPATSMMAVMPCSMARSFPVPCRTLNRMLSMKCCISAWKTMNIAAPMKCAVPSAWCCTRKNPTQLTAPDTKTSTVSC